MCGFEVGDDAHKNRMELDEWKIAGCPAPGDVVFGREFP